MADLPVGTIVAYHVKVGAAAPAGWAVCDGANGTPDLRGRFIRGTGDVASVGKRGGSNDATIPLPPHSHKLVTGHAANALREDGGSGVVNHTTVVDYLVNSYTDGGTGGNSRIDILPPFVDIIFIMKT